jgi:hypothetical protein
MTRRHTRKVAAFRPSVEALEDRALLSVYTVDRLTDLGEGSDLAGDLRYCIGQANASPGDDAIDFAVTGTITLNGTQLPSITDDLTISGPGAGLLSISGNNASRVFGVTAGTVAISGLTITKGSAGEGGGMWLTGGNVSLTGCVLTGNEATGDEATSGHGGAISASGATLTLTGCTVSFNKAADHGGGIDSPGINLTIIDSTFTGNSADEGGALSIGTGTVKIVNSTISGNSATSFGGGINSNFAADFDVLSSTIANNTANNQSKTGTGGGVRRLGGVFNVTNTIIAGNTADIAPDISGAVTSGGHNLVGNTSGASGFDLTDLLNVNPLLGPLTNNGGPTLTHALAAGSPALDAGDSAAPGLPGTDQRGRGFARVSGAVDIGAYENATPVVSAGPDEFLNVGEQFVRVGSFTDDKTESFFTDTHTATVNYGDGTGEQRLPLTEDGRFTLLHVYQTEGSFAVVVTVTDSGRAVGTAVFTADVLLAGVPTDPAVKVTAPPGATVTASTGGVTVTLIRAPGGPDLAAIIVAVVPTTVAGSLDSGFTSSNPDVITSAFDVRAINVGPGDRAIVTVQYANDNFDLPTVSYFDRATRQQREVLASQLVIDRFARTVTLLFGDKTPVRLSDLGGTVFTVSVPIGITPPPPFDPSPLSALLNLRGPGSPAAAFAATTAEGGASANTASFAQFARDDEVGGGGGVSDEAPGQGEGAAREPSVTSGLPPVASELVGLQAATATASFPDTLSQPPPTDESIPPDTGPAPEEDATPPAKAPPEGAGEGAEQEQEEEAPPAELEAPALEARDEAFARMGPGGAGLAELLLLAAAGLLLRSRRREEDLLTDPE